MEEAIIRRGVDLSKEILLSRDDIDLNQKFDLDCVRGEGRSVEVKSYTANKLVLVTSSGCGSFLSTSEVFYPGWVAKIDGQEVPVLRSNYAFRSLYVPVGEHKIEFYYSAKIYVYGFIISLLSGMGLFIIWKRRRF